MTISKSLFLAGTCLIVGLSSGTAAWAEATGTTAENSPGGEIVVTAQKRAERLIDIPVSVASFSGEELRDKNIASLSDLQQLVPGLAVLDKGAPGFRQLVIRGINSASTSVNSPLVATYVNDFVIGAANPSARGANLGLDLQPYDVASIEVLKGPQGTLYGADAMGGLIKYTLRDPSLNNLQASVGGGLVTIDHSSQVGQQLRAAVSIPLVAGKLAVRISGYEKYNPGYIDNVVLGSRDVNHSKQRGATGTVLWQATDMLKIRALAVYQLTDVKQLGLVNLNGATLQPIYGNYKMATPFSEFAHQTTLLAGVSVDWDLGFATLTDATGYSRLNSRAAQDLSPVYGGFCQPGAFAGDPGCAGYPHADALALFIYGGNTKKFTQEARLASPASNRLQWMVGATYASESSDMLQSFPIYTPAGVATGDNLLLQISTVKYRDLGFFGNATFKVTPKFEIGAGARYTRYYLSTYPHQSSGVIASPLGPNQIRPGQGVTTWSADVRYHFNPDAMIYARAATAFRPGGGCPTCGNPALEIPGQFNADRTTNYEAGVKGKFLDRKLTLTADAFLIDWTDIQLTTRNSRGLNFSGNGGTARSKGFEASGSFRVSPGLDLNGSVAYTDARLTEDALAAGGLKGDRLPGTSPWSGIVGIDYVRPISDNRTVLAGASLSFRSSQYGNLAHTASGGVLYPYKMDSQHIANAYLGTRIGRATVRATLSNIFNEVAYNGVAFPASLARPSFIPVRPRALDLSIDYTF